MTDQDALLRAVHAHPDDDTPRLVYADWLDEHGDPRRAEFVRVQCRIARADDDRPYPGLATDAFREYELWRVGGRTWAAGLPGAGLEVRPGCQVHAAVGGVPVEYTFRRGFADRAALMLSTFTDPFARELVVAAPLTEVVLLDRRPSGDANSGFGWYESPFWENMGGSLPPELYPGFWRYGIVALGSPVWATEAEARAALSRLCVAHGRALAEKEL